MLANENKGTRKQVLAQGCPGMPGEPWMAWHGSWACSKVQGSEDQNNADLEASSARPGIADLTLKASFPLHSSFL